MKKYAILNQDNILVGFTKKGKIEIGDLPTDGSYKYKDGAFIPVGFGFGKPRAPSHTRDEILAMVIESLDKGRPLPSECMDWVKHLKARG